MTQAELITKYKELDLRRGISATKSFYGADVRLYIRDFITISQEMTVIREQIGQTHDQIMGYVWE